MKNEAPEQLLADATRELRNGKGSGKGGKGKSSSAMEMLDKDTFCGIVTFFDRTEGAPTDLVCEDIPDSVKEKMCPSQDFLCDPEFKVSDYCGVIYDGCMGEGCKTFIEDCCELSCCQGSSLSTHDACKVYSLVDWQAINVCVDLDAEFCPCEGSDATEYCKHNAGYDCTAPCMSYISECC